MLARDDAEMARVTAVAAAAFSSLETSQAARVQAARRAAAAGGPSALRTLARDCTEEPLAQRGARRGASRLDQFNRDLPLAPLA